MSKKLLIALIVIVLTLSAAAGLTACNTVKKYAKKAAEEIEKAVDGQVVAIDDTGNELLPDEVYEMPSGLTFEGCASTSEGAGGASSVTLHATVTPATAHNKQVDWFVSWLTPESAFAAGKQVTDYVTVVPESDGSTTAVVTCLLPFDAEVILVTCVTREGGYSASCNVTFFGHPRDIEIVTSIELTLGESHYVNRYILSSSDVYDFDITLDNEWGQVNPVYGNYTVEVTGYGTITVCNWWEDAGGGHWDGEARDISINDVKSAIIEASIVDGKLHIVTKKAVQSYYSHTTGNASYFIKHDLFKAYKLMDQYDAFAHFKVRVTETNSGLTTYINVDVLSGVTGLSLDSPSIEF
jgi:predicted small secreted protein